MTTSPFVPSSAKLFAMLEDAMARFDADREQDAMRKERREEEREVKAMTNEVKAKYYARIQRGY